MECNERLIELLSSLPERFGVQLHAYALMGNHYHLGWKAERQTSAKPCTGWMSATVFGSIENTTASGLYCMDAPRRSSTKLQRHSWSTATFIW